MEVVLITQNINMKYKISVILAFIYCYFYPLSAQVPLTTTTNTLRHGDILCKVEVHYVEAGERGEDEANEALLENLATHASKYFFYRSCLCSPTQQLLNRTTKHPRHICRDEGELY